jgi:hypothetical protein
MNHSTSRALLGAIVGLVVGSVIALDARGWVLGPPSSFVIQTVAAGIGGAFLFWLAAVIRNWLRLP